MNVKTYLALLKGICGNGPGKSLCTSSKSCVAFHVFPLSYFFFRMLSKNASLKTSITKSNRRKPYNHVMLTKLLQIVVVQVTKALMPQMTYLI